MMLRTVKSLPSLRLLYQQEVHSLKTQSSHVTLKTSQPQSTNQIRNVHQTTKKETILLDKSANKSKYTTMNLQGLKMECRKRGLKVSGRKIDLVQRLTSQDDSAIENTRSYSSVMTNKSDYSNDMPSTLQDFKLGQSPKSTSLNMKMKSKQKNDDVISKMKAQKEEQMSDLKKKIEEQKIYELKRKEEDEKIRQLKLMKQNEVRKQLELKKQEDKRKSEEQKRRLELQKQIEHQKQIELQKQVEIQKQIEEQKQRQIERQREHDKLLLEKKEAKLQNAVRSAVSSSIKEKAAADALKKAQKESKLKIIQEAKESLKLKANEQKKKQQQQKQNNENSQTDDKLTKRDVGFLTIFSASTIGWWSLKE